MSQRVSKATLICLPQNCKTAEKPVLMLGEGSATSPKQQKKTTAKRYSEVDQFSYHLPRSPPSSPKPVQQFVPVTIPTKASRKIIPPSKPAAKGKQVIQVHLQKEEANTCIQKLFKKIKKLTQDLSTLQNRYVKVQAQHSLCAQYVIPAEDDYLHTQPARRQRKRQQRVVKREVQVPVQKIIQVPFTRIVQKEVIKMVEGPVKWVDKLVQKPVYIEVQKIQQVEVVREVQKLQLVEVQVQKLLIRDDQIEVPVQKIVYVDKPIEIEQIIYVDKPVYQKIKVPVQRKKEVPVDVPFDVIKEVPYLVRKEVPIDLPYLTRFDYPVKKKVLVPVYKTREVKVEVPYEVEVPYRVQVPIQKPIYKEKEVVKEVDIGQQHRLQTYQLRRQNQRLKMRIEEVASSIRALVGRNQLKSAELESLLNNASPFEHNFR